MHIGRVHRGWVPKGGLKGRTLLACTRLQEARGKQRRGRAKLPAKLQTLSSSSGALCAPQVAAGCCLQVAQHPLNHKVDNPLGQEGGIHLQW